MMKTKIKPEALSLSRECKVTDIHKSIISLDVSVLDSLDSSTLLDSDFSQSSQTLPYLSSLRSD
jgi:hypothetical protein